MNRNKVRLSNESPPNTQVDKDSPTLELESMFNLTLEVSDNHIFFSTQIYADTALRLSRMLYELDGRLTYKSSVKRLEQRVPIWLHINSAGGELFSAFAIADTIKTLNSPVYSVIEGHCASAATIISMACERRYCLPNSLILLHPLNADISGNYQDMLDDIVMIEMLHKKIVRFYVEHSTMTEALVTDTIKGQKWFDYEGAKENGIVDMLYEKHQFQNTSAKKTRNKPNALN